ncbi:MAG TPA: anti-sigma factor [Opitutaceae bacterium]|nr:anti-sigma factor [Opitutaceae bacterium]
MIDDRQEELAALYALDLLEGEEREQFVAELGRSSELRRRVGDLRQAATALAHAAPEADPPAALKARILASASAQAGRRPASEDAPAALPRAGRPAAFPSWVPWLAAACFGVAAIWSEKVYLAARSENLSLREEQRLAQLALEQTRGQLGEATRLLATSGREIAELNAKLKAEGDLAHFKIATLASMLGNSPAALAVAVWDPAREEGVLTVSKLPALAAEMDYQLWVIDPQYPSPVSGGVFVVDPATGEAHVVFRVQKPVKSIAKFAVSLERKGGVPKPEGPIVLLSQ